MNILQDIINAIMGDSAFIVADLDINVQALLCLFLIVFAYMALRSVSRFFLNLGNKF